MRECRRPGAECGQARGLRGRPAAASLSPGGKPELAPPSPQPTFPGSGSRASWAAARTQCQDMARALGAPTPDARERLPWAPPLQREGTRGGRDLSEAPLHVPSPSLCATRVPVPSRLPAPEGLARLRCSLTGGPRVPLPRGGSWPPAGLLSGASARSTYLAAEEMVRGRRARRSPRWPPRPALDGDVGARAGRPPGTRAPRGARGGPGAGVPALPCPLGSVRGDGDGRGRSKDR